MIDWIKLFITSVLVLLVLLIAIILPSPSQASQTETKQPPITQPLVQVQTLITNNQLQQANTLIDDLLKDDPDNTDALYWKGVVSGYQAKQASIFKAGAFAKQSRRAFEKALEVDATYVAGYQGLIGFYLDAPAIAGGSAKKAQQLAEQLKAFAPLEGALSLLRVAQYRENEEQIEHYISQLEQSFPSSPQAQFAVGFYFQDLKNYDKAYRAFKRATNLDDSAASTGYISDQQQGAIQSAIQSALYQLGRNAVFSEKHLEDGIKAMKRYLALEQLPDLPSKTWGQYRLSQLYVLNQQPQAAKQTLSVLHEALLAEEHNQDRELLKLVKRSLKTL
ncbi:hypothetical protein J1N51_06575 [Psychrosphaera ytuae]|uniref:Outer membrane lipoprotein BamD-like domain-containing protein n=1 Tax=Psychrosphaera ytuae TaxID=2820710 RepID=A0A975HJC9_9GAMM|nr:hypothetical protein [Psychrosphaera ytuae]QTH65098.1 hypothetical protein J1N51_06575 [Psychrosphaera ytuae]